MNMVMKNNGGDKMDDKIEIGQELIPNSKKYIRSEPLTAEEATKKGYTVYGYLKGHEMGYIISPSMDSNDQWFATMDYIFSNYSLKK